MRTLMMVMVVLGLGGCAGSYMHPDPEIQAGCEEVCLQLEACPPAEVCPVTHVDETCRPGQFVVEDCLETCATDETMTQEDVDFGRTCLACFVEQTECNLMYLQEFCQEECFPD